MLEEKLCTQQQLDAIKDKAFNTIEISTKFGIDSPLPNPADVAKDVYVEETYPAQLIESEKATSKKVAEATDAFEKALATSTAKTKKEAADSARATDKSPVRYGDLIDSAGCFAGAGRRNEAR